MVISLGGIDPESELRHFYIEINNTNDASELAQTRVVPVGCRFVGGYFASDTEVTQSQIVISVQEALSSDAIMSQTLLNPDSGIAAGNIFTLDSASIADRFISAGTPIVINVSTTTGGPDGDYIVCLRFHMDANAECK